MILLLMPEVCFIIDLKFKKLNLYVEHIYIHILTIIEKLPDTIKRELKVKVQNKLLQTAGYFDETDNES